MAELLRPLAIIGLYALLLPVFGPALDHHFAEWQHNHDHIYLGSRAGFGADHVHAYELSGRHEHRPAPASRNGQPLPEGLVFLTAFDSAGAGAVYAPIGSAAASLCFPASGGCPPLAGYLAEESVPPGFTPAPPRKPPTF